jgi:plasmid stabilization system protein ParE
MEVLKLRFAARAHRHLDEILSYIAFDNPGAAQSIVEHIESLLDKVLGFPDLGRMVFEDLPHREMLAYPFRLIYRRTEQTIEVVAILRVEQLLRRSLLETGSVRSAER